MSLFANQAAADADCILIFSECWQHQRRGTKLIVELRNILCRLSATKKASSTGKQVGRNVLPPLSKVGLDFNPILEEMKSLVSAFQMTQDKLDFVSGKKELCSFVNWYKVQHMRNQLQNVQITIYYLVNQVIQTVLREVAGGTVSALDNSHSQLESLFKLAVLYNSMLSEGGGEDHNTARDESNLGAKVSLNVNSLRTNTCPVLRYPLRRLSITKIFQILAQQRAECGCHELVGFILKNYILPDVQAPPDNSVWTKIPDSVNRRMGIIITSPEKLKNCTCYHESDGSDVCSDSSHATSLEIARDLTGHLTPPLNSLLPPVERTHRLFRHLRRGNCCEKIVNLDLQVLNNFMDTEEHYIRTLLSVVANIPEMIGTNGVKRSKNGDMRVSKGVHSKVLTYYQEVLWGEVGTYIDHVLLWWKKLSSDLPLFGTWYAECCVSLRNWLQDAINTNDRLPQIILPAVQSLIDGLGCHITTVTWDQQFRKTLVDANFSSCKLLGKEGTDPREGTVTGQQYMEVLRSLVVLINQCERSRHPEEFPLVEQIPILHRLDHTIHICRLWVIKRSKQVINNWSCTMFFLISQTDVNKCLDVLGKLQLLEMEDLTGVESVHVTVCAKMRTKLVSEVQTNHGYLKKQPDVCIAGMAVVCRCICLANLHMCMPNPKYWRGNGPLPEFASPYVEEYLDKILRPMLTAVSHLNMKVQETVTGMVLRILCEAWLDHIYQQKIKFSEWGALQLLADFGAVPTWLQERATVSNELQRYLLRMEVLRRCEGVGRLLLRSPGETLGMSVPRNKVAPADSSTGSPQSTGLDAMPAEMYVTNQEQWLELRARRRGLFMCSCCR